MKKITIYQIKEIGCPYIFRSWKFADSKFCLNDYKKVYSCYRENEYSPDDCFEEFNIRLPEDYRGRSLSVSDILDIDGIIYYCDNLGWRNITRAL